MTTVHLRAMAPLSRFRTSITSLDLSNGVLLRALSPTEQLQMAEASSLIVGISGLGLPGPRYTLEVEEDIDLDFRDDMFTQFNLAVRLSEFADERFKLIEQALRLLKRGDVYCGIKLTFLDYAVDRPAPRELSRPAGLAREYQLEDRDVDDFHLIMLALTRLSPTPALEVALSRFQSSYEKSDPGDQLLDLWIGLDALFKERRKGRYSQIASFLTNEQEAHEWIANSANLSYGVRSDVAHGRPTKSNVRQVRNRTETLLRLVLLKSLGVLDGDVPLEAVLV